MNNIEANNKNELNNLPEILKSKFYSYELRDFEPSYSLIRPGVAGYFVTKDFSLDPGVIRQKTETELSDFDMSKGTLIEASLTAADDYIRNGDLESLKKYYDSWKVVESEKEMTPHEFKIESVRSTQDEYGDWYPDLFEYLYFANKESIEGMIEKSKRETTDALFKNGGSVWVPAVNQRPKSYVEIPAQSSSKFSNPRIIRRLVYDDSTGVVVPQECNIEIDLPLARSWVLEYLDS